MAETPTIQSGDGPVKEGGEMRLMVIMSVSC